MTCYDILKAMRKPFYKTSRNCWYVTINGKQTRLDPDKDKAFTKWKELTLPTNAVKVTNVVKRFLDRPRKPSTQRFYENHLRLFLAEAANLRVSDLRAYHLTDLLDKHPGQNYRHNIARTVKTCFKWLVDNEHIERSPFSNVKTPPSVSRGDEAYLTDEQVSRILDTARGDLHDILTFLHETGCRPKEARTLQSRHLREQTAVFPKEESKGGRNQRVIHLPDEIVALVQRLRLKRPTGPLFLNGDKPWTSQALVEKCKGFTPYQLRHSFATSAILRGVDLLTIATLMGHTDLKMLTKVYQHIQRCDQHLKAGLEKIVA